MRLHRTIFYFMLIIFVTGIVVASTVEFSTVVSRIATGLISGAMVGLLSSLANYYYSWQSFFRSIFDSIYELFNELELEIIKAKRNVEMIEENDKQTIINLATPPTIEELRSEKKRELKYGHYRLKFDGSAYAPLLWYSKKTKNALDELYWQAHDLERIASYSEMKDLFVCLQEGHFSSKEEEKICIGEDRDAFFKFVVDNIIDWRDYTGYMIRKLCDSTTKLQQSFKPFILGKDYKELVKNINGLAKYCLEGVPDRNPMDEPIEDEEEDDNEDNNTE